MFLSQEQKRKTGHLSIGVHKWAALKNHRYIPAKDVDPVLGLESQWEKFDFGAVTSSSLFWVLAAQNVLRVDTETWSLLWNDQQAWSLFWEKNVFLFWVFDGWIEFLQSLSTLTCECPSQSLAHSCSYRANSASAVDRFCWTCAWLLALFTTREQLLMCSHF